MNRSQQKRKRMVVVSTFSGMDLFLLAMLTSGMLPGYSVERNIYAAFMHAANFKNSDGTSVIEFINITEEEFKHRKGYTVKSKKPLEDTCIKNDDGQYIRTREIQEISGKQIRESIERKYGNDIIIILIGGPPCQDFTPMNVRRDKSAESRNFLIFEFLRILEELRPDIAIMEEVPAVEYPDNKDIYKQFLDSAILLPYRIMKQEMSGIHYRGNQNRWRPYFLFVDEKYKTDPCFPVADDVNVKRVKDFLDIDYFCHGNFSYGLKTKNDLMPTVTSGNPKTFYKDGKAFPPSIDDLLLCFDVEKGMYIIPEWIPRDQVKQAIGNSVCVSVVKALAKTITEQILRVKADGDGYWIPIEEEEPKENDIEDTPTIITEATGETLVQNDSSQHLIIIAANKAPIEESGKNTEPPTELNNSAIEPMPPVHTSVSLPNVPFTVPTVSTFVTPKKKIISSLDLAAMRFMSLNFTGAWEQFIGHPSYNFNCLIHGKPGGGKSTLAIQFAKFLSDNFGRVVYISGEEGISKTLQNKFLLTDSLSGSIDVADLRSYEDIIRNVASKSYQFIFIDSLNSMKISVDELREIRNRYKESAIITISQATKEGLIRGSNEFVHDCDVHVMVEGGIASTLKNRFGNTGGVTYSVFNNLETLHKPIGINP